MEPQTPSAPTVQTPVMDVVPPPSAEPTMAAPPVEEEDDLKSSETSAGPQLPLDKSDKYPTPPKPKTAAPEKSSITAAIIATVVIVLGLAGLAVMAFLKQK